MTQVFTAKRLLSNGRKAIAVLSVDGDRAREVVAHFNGMRQDRREIHTAVFERDNLGTIPGCEDRYLEGMLLSTLREHNLKPM